MHHDVVLNGVSLGHAMIFAHQRGQVWPR
jgi:hypothetical protein